MTVNKLQIGEGLFATHSRIRNSLPTKVLKTGKKVKRKLR